MLEFDYEAEQEYIKQKDNVSEFVFTNQEMGYSRIITIIKNPPKVILKYRDDRNDSIIEEIECDPFDLDIRKYDDNNIE